MHEVSMYHPGKPSYYDKSAAMREMDMILCDVYPRFMKDKYNEDVGGFNESQTVFEMTMKV
jgi:hypothetical protein